MITILDYVDYHASRFTQDRTRRQIENLHALAQIAQWLMIIQARKQQTQ